MRIGLLAASLSAAASVVAQSTYYPPLAGNTWQTIDPASLGWCTDQIPPLLEFLDGNSTKAFIVLKDGRIAIEHYFGTFTQDSLWYWASAGKSLTAFLVGKAQEEGFLSIDEPSSDFLGVGWTDCDAASEGAITVRNQLTMTTGLDDGVPDPYCTDPACLQCLAAPGTRWAYHNGPYTLLDGVIAGATGQTLNSYVFNKLTLTTGLQGAFLQTDENNVFYSKPRAMARFGLLCLSQGTWNGTAVMNDAGYFHDMTTPSQSINPAYGYLWWLNGQSSYMLPGLQVQIPGLLVPSEPVDGINALGKNGQILSVVPSQGLVMVRMGNAPSSVPVPYLLTEQIWQRLSAVVCTPTAARAMERNESLAFPNPASDEVRIGGLEGRTTIVACAADGRQWPLVAVNGVVDVGQLPAGLYRISGASSHGKPFGARLVVAR